MTRHCDGFAPYDASEYEYPKAPREGHVVCAVCLDYHREGHEDEPCACAWCLRADRDAMLEARS